MGRLAAAAQRPDYDRAGVRPGIVHIGIGAFHRGHMAVYIDDLLAREPEWGITGASLRRPDTRDALAPQDCLYSVNVQDAGGTRSRIIGSVLDVIDASAGSGALVAALADARTRIVSLTVTEKGYCHNPATGELARRHPDIVHDLDHPEDPRSVPGILVAAARARRDAGIAGFTVLSCDNLQGNGHIARTVVLELARMQDEGLAAWIEAHVTFPTTMVDRIVPALTDRDREDIAGRLGLTDQWPILTEPFSQWVIEDDFAAGRPDLASVGAQLVADVEPFETMKLRMLNGSHSALAHLGQLAGHGLVSEAVGDAALRPFLTRLMTDEVMPTLTVEAEALPGYRDALLERFANPALRHRLAQIAADGSQKMPQRVLAPMREQLAAGGSVTLLTLSLAGWIAYLRRLVLAGQTPADPMAQQIAAALTGAEGTEAAMRAMIEIAEIFGTDLADDPRVTGPLARHLGTIEAGGVHAAIRQALG